MNFSCLHQSAVVLYHLPPDLSKALWRFGIAKIQRLINDLSIVSCHRCYNLDFLCDLAQSLFQPNHTLSL